MMCFSSKEKCGWQTSPYYKENVPMFYHKRRHVFYPSTVAFLKEFSYLAKTDKKKEDCNGS